MAHTSVARTIELACQNVNPVFMAVSFVGSNALAAELGTDGAGVYATQVALLPQDDSIAVGAAYQTAMVECDPNARPGFVSLAVYLAGRLAIAELEACGPETNRDCFLSEAREPSQFDTDGFQLQSWADDTERPDAVYLTEIGEDASIASK